MTSMVTQQAFGVDPAQDTRTFQVRTYGCQMNVHDSERLAGLLEAAGYRRAEDGTDADVVVYDALTYSGNLANLAPVAENPRYRFVHADIRDASALDRELPHVDVVVHFAADIVTAGDDTSGVELER